MASRTLTVQILGDSRSLERAFSRSSRGARGFQGDMNRTVRGTLAGSGAFRSLGQSIAFASTSFLGAAGFTAAVRKSISAASDLNEEISKSGVLFGDSASRIRSWSETTASSIGIAQAEALRAAGNFGAMFETIGLGDRVSAQMSQRLVQLGADMASFNNEDPSEMLDRLRSGLAGEAEPLRRFGVLLSEARVQQEAWASGIAEQGAKLTEQQKVQARYNLLLKDSAAAQGDFARTSGGLANQQRILRAQIEELAAKLGTQLLPFVTDITTRLTEWLGKTENQERVQRTFADALTTTADVLGTLRDVIGPIIKAVGGLGNAIKLLIGFMVVRRVARFVEELYTIRAAAMAAAGGASGTAGVGLLLARLKLLARLSPIVIEIAIAKKFYGGDPFGIGPVAGEARKIIEGEIGDVDWSKLLTGDKGLIGRQFKDAGQTAGKAFATGFNTSATPALDQIIASTIRDAPLAATSFGGAPPGFRQEDLTAATRRAGITAEQRNAWFDALVGRRQDRVQDIRALEGQLRELDNIAALIQERIEKTKDITRRLNLEDELLDVRRRQRSIREQIASNRQAHLEEMKALAEQRRQLQIEAREREALARATRQFRALGLGPGGAELVPNAESLRRTLGRVSDAVKGTMLDTSATRSLLARIRKVLAGGFGKIGQDVRATIDGMLDDITDKLKDFSEGGPQTKFRKTSANKLLQGLGLDPDEIKALRGRLSQVGVGGTVPTRSLGAFGVPVSATAGMNFSFQVNLDGQPLEATVTRRQRTRRRRNPVQKRGPAVTGG